MAVLGLVAITLVLLWLLATLSYQHSALQPTLGRLDVFKLLPTWSFFAPNPANRDSQIVVRELRADGSLTPWAPICFGPDRSLLHLFWHPAKRPRKVLRDASKSIIRNSRHATSKGVVQCSLPYLVVLHFCLTQRTRGDNAVAIQFAIIETSGREERRIWITFISDFHRI